MPPKDPNALHIAIIPDGNRRWAKARAWHPWQGHEKAVENFRTITDWCRADPRIAVLTVWCFSTENWKRDPKEVAKLMTIFENYLQKERSTFHEKKTRLIHSGRKDRIPPSLASLITDVEAETKLYEDFILDLAVDYGGKDEVIRGLAKAKNTVSSEQDLRALLDHPELPDLDLIIRTSGEQRTSNFFLWQSAYAEWVFLDKLFPDFTTQDLRTAVDAFAKRARRFGG